ncbi:MAG: HPF/RaiA family ribosome-associated protein [Chloroflexi bacterium]|nr:HPF/RaiA family ribosome-associated protein [Chloroflexota bacterium]
MNDYSDFPIEFRSDLESPDIDYYVEIEDRIRALARGHQDITGAAASLEKPAQGRETTPIFEASIVVYIRPTSIAAVEKTDDPLKALQGALTAVERQVREQREKLRGY